MFFSRISNASSEWFLDQNGRKGEVNMATLQEFDNDAKRKILAAFLVYWCENRSLPTRIIFRLLLFVCDGWISHLRSARKQGLDQGRLTGVPRRFVEKIR